MDDDTTLWDAAHRVMQEVSKMPMSDAIVAREFIHQPSGFRIRVQQIRDEVKVTIVNDEWLHQRGYGER